MKTKDIALIYEGYLAALEGKHSDSSTRLYALAEFLKSNPDKIAATNFYITDIYDFSAPETEIIKSLANNALSLTVGITSGYNNPNSRIYPDRVAKRLASLCDGRVQIEKTTKFCLHTKMRFQKNFSHIFPPTQTTKRIAQTK